MPLAPSVPAAASFSRTLTFAASPVETLTTTSSVRSDIVRVGLNYQIGH